MSMSRDTAGPPDEGSGRSGGATCYRHRDRETWVRCSRCDRPICPDCMREATVGFQCPDCVNSGTRTVRQNRTIFGGRVRASTSLVTWALIAINVAFYAAELATPRSDLVYRLGMWPAQVVVYGQWWRIVSSAFLHAPHSPWHILLNMWALWVLGPHLEALLGRLRFSALYLLSALGGSTLIYLIGPLGQVSIGASGAIFGLFGATFIVARRLNLDTRWIVGIVAINVVITFVIAGISWQAHIGGLVTGTLLAAAYAYAPRSRRTWIHLGASLGMLLLIIVLLALRTTSLVG